MAAKPNDSRIVNTPLPKSVLLKDYLLDDLSSCSSNGFRSYPRRQCCTKVRYLIEIDLNRHIKLQPTHKQLLKSRSKSKSKLKSKSSSSVLNKASAAVVNVFKSFNFSGEGKRRKGKLLPRNLSLKMSKNGFWKRTIDRNKLSSGELMKRKEIVVPVVADVSGGGAAATAEVKMCTSNSNSNSNSSVSVDSYFTATSDCSTIDDSLKNNVAHNVVEEGDVLAMEKMNPVIGENVAVATTSTATNSDEKAKEKSVSMEKDHFSPNSVMNFPCDNDNADEDEDEVTSPFHDIYLYVEGSKQKVMPKIHRIMTLKPVRLEDRITLSKSTSHDSILEASLQESKSELKEYQAKKKAIALIQLFKATMPSHAASESTMIESFLLEFFSERVIEGNVSNYAILQDAKDWVNGLTRDTFDSDNYKLAYVRDMEKRAKWITYDYEVGKEEVVSVLEYEIITSLVEEMLLDLYL